MKSFRKGHAIIVELIIVILFFSLSSVIIMRLFSAAHQLSEQSTASTKLLLAAQSWADQLMAEDDFTVFLAENGWSGDEDGFALEVDGGTLKATGFYEEQGLNGSLSSYEIAAFVNQREVFAFPVARYRGEDVP